MKVWYSVQDIFESVLVGAASSLLTALYIGWK